MKDYRFIITTLFIISGLVWQACQEIDHPLVIVNEQDIPGEITDTNFFLDSAIVTEKQVLLEEFTGHLCVNCPEAAIMAHELAASLDHKLIIYSVHAGYFAIPGTTGLYTTDLRSSTGEELYNYFEVFINPNALIDRVDFNGSAQIGPDDWESAVEAELEKPAVVNLKLYTAYYPNLNTLRIQTDAMFKEPAEGKYKVCVYIAEDSIVAPQKNNNPNIGPSPDWEDYIHRNVLRGAVNTTFGEYLSTDGGVLVNQNYLKEYYYEINPAWVKEHCNIIAFIYEEESEEILQVAETEVKTTE